ncbi:MAG TPA: molybdate ABC transporter permease subunit [Firmicutes bacterium]|jgi:molybdate transport system permease protein|nr:molybdate ABC transporter permease subunit [Bacillota bacterium]
MFDWQPVLLSFKISAIALVFVVVIGTLIAYLVVRGPFRFPGKDLIETLVTLPLVLPPVVTGFTLLLLFGRQGPLGRLLNNVFHTQIVFTPCAAVVAALVVSLPLMYQSAKAAFQTVDRHLEDVARTLKASETKVFLTITLPLAWPGLLSGIILSFSRALGEFGATAMVAGNIPGKTQTIPVAIFFASESNDLRTAGFYVLIISAVTFIMVFGVNYWSRRKMQRLNGRG